MKLFRPNKTTKAVLLGTGIGVCAVVIAYFVMWAVSKIFIFIHEAIKSGIFPWFVKYWWVLLIAWVIITVAATVYYNLENFHHNERKTNNSRKVEEPLEKFDYDDGV